MEGSEHKSHILNSLCACRQVFISILSAIVLYVCVMMSSMYEHVGGLLLVSCMWQTCAGKVCVYVCTVHVCIM